MFFIINLLPKTFKFNIVIHLSSFVKKKIVKIRKISFKARNRCSWINESVTEATPYTSALQAWLCFFQISKMDFNVSIFVLTIFIIYVQLIYQRLLHEA